MYIHSFDWDEKNENHIKDSGRIRVITARDMIKKGKRYYKKRKGVR